MAERDLDGKVCLITGANTGIGRAAARDLARRGDRVRIACRSQEKGRAAADAIRDEAGGADVDLLALDLADLGSVRETAEAFLARGEPLHILINNAGVAGHQGLTRDGFELAFGVNHLGHFLLTRMLLDRLRESRPARIVNVSSSAHYPVKGIDWDAVKRPTATMTGLREYGVSKLANVLFTAELAHRFEADEIASYALHPGAIASDIWRRIPTPFRQIATAFMGSNEDGARTVLHCAASPEAGGQTGLFYRNCRPTKPSRAARDPELAAELWRRSESLCGLA